MDSVRRPKRTRKDGGNAPPASSTIWPSLHVMAVLTAIVLFTADDHAALFFTLFYQLGLLVSALLTQIQRAMFDDGVYGERASLGALVPNVMDVATCTASWTYLHRIGANLEAQRFIKWNSTSTVSVSFIDALFQVAVFAATTEKATKWQPSLRPMVEVGFYAIFPVLHGLAGPLTLWAMAYRDARARIELVEDAPLVFLAVVVSAIRSCILCFGYILKIVQLAFNPTFLRPSHDD